MFPKSTSKAENLTIFAFFISALFIWFGILATKYYNLGYFDWDLAIYNQIVWSLSQGRTDASLWGINFLANHAEYITFFIVPIYKIFSHPLTLIFLKVFSFVSGAYILFLLTREKFSLAISLLFSFLFLIYPPNIFALLHEFNIESLNIIFLFLLFYFYHYQQYVPFLITMFFLSLIKENMPAIIVMFGIWGLLSKDRNKVKWGVIPFSFGIVSLYLILFVITPWFRKDFSTSNQYISIFNSLGNSFPEIFTTIILKPFKILKLIITHVNISYVCELLIPFMFIPIFKPQILFLALPIFLQNFFSTSLSMHTIYYHYAATLSPFIFLATVESFAYFHKIIRAKSFNIILITLIILFFINLKSYDNDIKRRTFYDPKISTQLHWQMINSIDKDDGIITSFQFLAPLSNRKSIQTFYTLVRDTQGLNFDTHFQLLDTINYALIDFNDPWLMDRIFSSESIYLQRLSNFFNDNWRVKMAIENTVLFKKSNEGIYLVEHSPKPFSMPAYKLPPVSINGDFSLLSTDINPALSQSSYTIPLTFFWRADKNIQTSYSMYIYLKRNGHIIHTLQKTVGYLIHPTSQWKEGEFIKEHVWILNEKATPGRYTIEIDFNATKNNHLMPLNYISESAEKKQFYKLNIGEIQLK